MTAYRSLFYRMTVSPVPLQCYKYCSFSIFFIRFLQPLLKTKPSYSINNFLKRLTYKFKVFTQLPVVFSAFFFFFFLMGCLVLFNTCVNCNKFYPFLFLLF